LAAEVERLRLDFPMWGKSKIGPIVRELGFAVSDATVGRILSELIKRGRVPAVPALLRKIGPRSAPKKRPYAVRKPKDVAFEKPGDVVQIDTLSISILPGQTIKQFTAYDPFAKWTVAKPYKRATAKNAAEFLARVRAQMPNPVRAVQIDGGSEFMAEFEQACAVAKIPLYVLPPRSPKLTDVIDKCFLAGLRLFFSRARVTARRRAGCEAQALPRSLHCRPSFAAPVRARLGPRGFHPATKRA
jgi:hypothetical protein